MPLLVDVWRCLSVAAMLSFAFRHAATLMLPCRHFTMLRFFAGCRQCCHATYACHSFSCYAAIIAADAAYLFFAITRHAALPYAAAAYCYADYVTLMPSRQFMPRC